MRQLIIGPRYNKDKVTIGGSEVLCENWLDFCTRNQHDFDLIDGNKFNYSNKLVALISIYWNIMVRTHKCDVIFLLGSLNDYLYISPWVSLVAMIFRKPFYLKKFGGVFHIDYEMASRWKRLGVRWAMTQATGLFWELKAQVPFGLRFNPNSLWIPNTRKNSGISRQDTVPYRRKFVFMSHVRKEKGVDEMLAAFNKLGREYQLDIYGTLMDYSIEQLGGRYKGVVDAKKVPSVLSQYDCLVLDSSWKEGYPGIIIEAFSVGVPVVVSNAGGIPEIVTDGYNGVICKPQSVEALLDGISRFEKLDYKKVCLAAASSFDAFDENRVLDSVITEFENCIKK